MNVTNGVRDRYGGVDEYRRTLEFCASKREEGDFRGKPLILAVVFDYESVIYRSRLFDDRQSSLHPIGDDMCQIATHEIRVPGVCVE